MAKSNKSKWILGLTGTALSAFVIGQIGGNQLNKSEMTAQTISTKSMNAEEKKLLKLDWSNYSINGFTLTKGVGSSDRQTKRS